MRINRGGGAGLLPSVDTHTGSKHILAPHQRLNWREKKGKRSQPSKRKRKAAYTYDGEDEGQLKW
jgi:hypothetical protein